MSSSGGESKGVQQVNGCVKTEYQKDVNGFVGAEPGSQGDDESRTKNVQENGGTHPPLQPLQGSLVWERFLHVRSVKVMLVEDDDCTRHIVTALLRNCNYEVIEATNGFQAWKILENLSNHIDIVLTEVVMPCLSGIGLLCKIMSHKTRRNIPVIMMSSHDSMGLVFKCLSKGAVDFLVKPIRKNELKNLWQHVWRRCHSSSGSGSESGTQAQKSVNSKNNRRYDNSSSSKDGDDNKSSSGGSDDGSGTQSSWTKQAVERESPEAASPCDETAEHPDSTCGIFIPPVDQDGQPYNNGKGKEIATCRYRNSEMQIEVPRDHNDIEQNTHPYMKNKDIEGQEEPEKIIDVSNGVIVGEIGLKRARHTEHDMREVQNGYNILRHSELSAFTRYKTTSNVVKGTPINTASCPQPDYKSDTVKKESKRDARSDGYQGSSEQVTPRTSDGSLPQDQSIQHIHHYHHVHHYHDIDEEEQPLSNHDDFGLKKLAADAPYCGSSNIMGGPVEDNNNLENNSLNRSGSGSKHGSNVPNGSKTAVNFEAVNGESDAGGNGIHGQKSAHREAALIKFRQKREVRCFQKKVRYQNRKKLAEQRPRVRGQFVKGSSRATSSNAADN